MNDFQKSVLEEVTGNALWDMLVKYVLATLWACLILKLWPRPTAAEASNSAGTFGQAKKCRSFLLVMRNKA